ncbi:zinc-ribbon and DUF3426 domain-containing protein [Aquincola sp. MAHUQ-54]|uniref:Zinc-ribbon and DUF3426 domain-containing protein n=1 Tax=Aquincola agrisoli TaxID=3119538 RepID=A0AAW9QA27_9BURK
MSLATRCGQCGTVFRVVEDQLKVSEGWVRCGRCEAVFNALESLFDLDQEAPPPWPGAAEEQAPQVPTAAPPAVPAWAGEPPRSAAVSPLEPPPFAPSDMPDDGLPASARLDHRPLLHEPDDDALHGDPRFEPTHVPQDDAYGELDEPPLPPRSAALPLRESRPDVPPAPPRPPASVPDPAPAMRAPAAAPAAAAASSPHFVRQADQAARWRRPGVRTALAVAAALLALLLAGQMAVRWRDTLAVRWPESAPMLRALCGMAGCAVEPLRRVDSLAVDSSGLVKLEGTGNHYQFSVALRNHDRVPVMVPALELTLTDAQGQVVSRKVMQAAEMGSTRSTLPAGAAMNLRGVLAAGDRKLSGYTVEIFYP